MEIMGLDLHKRKSQLSITADHGTITDRRMATRGGGSVHRHRRGR